MSTRFNWPLAIGGVLLAGAIGIVAYNAGVSHGLAMAPAAAAAGPGAAAPALPPGAAPYYHYRWHRPWGFFPFGPLFSILLFILIARALFWRGYGPRWRHGYYGMPPSFEDWHRREHERMSGQPPGGSEVR